MASAVTLRMTLLVVADFGCFVPTQAADADTTGTNASSVEITPTEVRSLTVSPAGGTFGTRWDPVAQQGSGTLAIPGGHCAFGGPTQQQSVTVTNGLAAGHIYVNGAAAQPSDGGLPWSLGAVAAADVFTETTHNTVDGGSDQALGAAPICDLTFSPDTPDACAATPHETNDEFLRIDAPTSSADTSPTFTIVTTWTAVP